MNNKSGELIQSLAQSVTRHAALKKFGVGLAGMALMAFLGAATAAVAAGPPGEAVTVLDPAGDGKFPYDLYGAPVPSYLDIVAATVGLRRGTFHFEVRMSADIPADAEPHFTPSVNHLGPTFGILTDTRTAQGFKFFGQTAVYQFNFLVGALYSPTDSGIGLGLGWHGFLIDLSSFTVLEIPLSIQNDTLVFETSSTSLGSPASFQWALTSECDPVPVLEEKNKTTVLVDYVPDHGYAAWPGQ